MAAFRVDLAMHVPTLHTARLTLLPPNTAHEALYEAFYTDAGASSSYGGPLTSDAARARLASDIHGWQRQGFGVWVVQRRDEGDCVGTCGFWQGPGWPTELSWWLLPSVRGSGIAFEASQAAIRHAYREFGWPVVQTYMDDGNRAARSLVLRLGGEKVARRLVPDGMERDVFHLPQVTATN